MRRKRTMMSCRRSPSTAGTARRRPSSVMPGEGAVCPAMVMRGCLISTSPRMTPATSNTTMRGPSAAAAAARLPGPSESRLVTLITRPPQPPRDVAPKPSAFGKASSAALAARLAPSRTATAKNRLTITQRRLTRSLRAHRHVLDDSAVGGTIVALKPSAQVNQHFVLPLAQSEDMVGIFYGAYLETIPVRLERGAVGCDEFFFELPAEPIGAGEHQQHAPAALHHAEEGRRE